MTESEKTGTQVSIYSGVLWGGGIGRTSPPPENLGEVRRNPPPSHSGKNENFLLPSTLPPPLILKYCQIKAETLSNPLHNIESNNWFEREDSKVDRQHR